MTDVSVRGLRYHVERWGTGAPLVLLHGFTGSAEMWRPFRFAWPGRELIAVDLPGHGRTEFPSDVARARMAACVDDLASLMDALAIERTALLGYSLGGRVALRFALAYPQRVDTLILESASPGIVSLAERQARVAADERLAELLEREGVAAFVDVWEALPLWASQARLPSEVRNRLREARLGCSPLGLACSLRAMGAGVEEPVIDRLGELTMPVHLVVGADDAKYVALARTMADRLPNATVVIVPDAGHAVHLEQPARFAAIIGDVLGTMTRPTVGSRCRS
ncbi:MAG: putative 2-succinyl-6-hydroxy-2,4-cyclohexadiene-1-carboxylate synthase [Dehalococcoidia bacterium]|nr:MAG: putative 2-succinyl-6-hydroxy-2,4-cyclohexadiene-1-carboxylate synthase [Dehalococcoidia bacterium]